MIQTGAGRWPFLDGDHGDRSSGCGEHGRQQRQLIRFERLSRSNCHFVFCVTFGAGRAQTRQQMFGRVLARQQERQVTAARSRSRSIQEGIRWSSRYVTGFQPLAGNFWSSPWTSLLPRSKNITSWTDENAVVACALARRRPVIYDHFEAGAGRLGEALSLAKYRNRGPRVGRFATGITGMVAWSKQSRSGMGLKGRRATAAAILNTTSWDTRFCNFNSNY